MGHPAWWNQVVEQMRAHQQAEPATLAGAAFGVETAHDGRMISSVGAGWADNSICNIGSMTKPLTAAVVLMALEEHGRLDIDLPVWQLPGMDLYAEHPVKRRIQIRHLLQHSTGMPVFEQYTDWLKTPCIDPGGAPPSCADPDLDLGPTVPWVGSPGYTNECMFVDGRCRPARTLTLDQVSRCIMQSYPLLHEPGAQYTYSSANYIVAARIVEQLSGTSFNRYIKEHIFTPLGMADSFFIAQGTGDPAIDAWLEEGVTGEQRERIADVTLITRDGLMPPEVAPGPDGGWDKYRTGWRFVYPDGGMYSTVADLLTFLALLRDGGIHGTRRILSPAILRLMVEDQGFAHTMGMGYRRRNTPYAQNEGTLEHLGNIMTYFWYDPKPGNPVLGVFLSQRLANAVVNNNMAAGMRAIFKVFVPAVNSALPEVQVAR